MVCSGILHSFGGGTSGQLGNGQLVDDRTPTPVAALARIAISAIACGDFHTLAVSADGHVFAWGSNAEVHTPAAA